MAKKKQKIILYCKKCDKEATRNEEESNENWAVFAPICSICGEKLIIKI